MSTESDGGGAQAPALLSDAAQARLLFFFLGLVVTFLFIRFSVRMIRANVRWWPGNVSPGGLHIHHVVFGIVLMAVSGVSGLIIADHANGWRMAMAAVFGVGTALVLDEFALVLHLKDVYWTQQGRLSVDVIFLAVGVVGLLLLGARPLGFDGTILVGDEGVPVRFSTLIGYGYALPVLAFVVITLLKGKTWTGLLGIFVPVLSVVGAIRIARPGSVWARWRYPPDSKRREIALRREARFRYPIVKAKIRLQELIAGKHDGWGVAPSLPEPAASGGDMAAHTIEEVKNQARREDRTRGWRRRAATVLTALVQLCAIVSLLLLLGGENYTGALGEIIGHVDTFVPVAPSVFIAVVLGVLGAALGRRKRAALNTLMLYQALQSVIQIPLFVYLSTISPTELAEATGTEVSAADFDALLVDLGVSAAVGFLLIAIEWPLRPVFPARLAPGAWRRAFSVFVSGIVVSCVLGWGLAEIFPGTLRTELERLLWSSNHVTGQMVSFGSFEPSGPHWLGVLLGILGATVTVAALLTFFRTTRYRQQLAEDEELSLRGLLAHHGERDSLGYFATRRDKSVVFAPSGKAAVTYRVVAGTTLVSADPIGEETAWQDAIQVWLAEAELYGWIPGVLGASERGAKAYVDAGLKALEIGDEAILDVREFTLAGPERKAVRQAVNRVRRAGYTTRIRRHGEISGVEMEHLLRVSDAWRDASTERGFSMALGRLGDPSDQRCVMVEALDAEGRLRGLLSFTPWGRRGLSLDLMRRDREAENGLNEYMVSELAEASNRFGVQQISLNFAMFRAVFEEGARIGAGPILRYWRAVLGLASRFFQLESLYKSNAKYGPIWQPRYMCYRRARRLPRLSIAAGVAEGFVPAMRSLVRRGSGRTSLRADERGAEFVAKVAELDAVAAQARRRVVRWPEQVRVRRDKARQLSQRGIDPYPVAFRRDRMLADVRREFDGMDPDTYTGKHVSVAGRVIAKRDMGGVEFAVLSDFSGELQAMIAQDRLTSEAFGEWKSTVDLGDQVGVVGEVITSRKGELSVLADSWQLNAKCLHPLPDKHKGLADPESRVRRRYLDLMVNADSRSMLRFRSDAVRAIRGFLHEQEFLEVETPMLQAVHGGANARPFVTHINAYDMRMYLRIAPELFLKRLCVSGVDKVFELNRNFRNEGADATHNPEFTMLEAYQAYADYHTMLELVRTMIQRVATDTHGSPIARRTDAQGNLVEHDISGAWPVIGVHEALSRALGEEITPDTSSQELRGHLSKVGIADHPEWTRGQLILEGYEHLVEAHTVRPTFYRDFPTDVSPLTRQHRDDPRLAERWDLVAFGAEIATAYSELTDPIEQRARLESQSLRAASGDVEAMELDEEFLRALEHGMPPTGGLGMGVDRLLMMLTGSTIRQTVLFPFVRAERES